jgi:hypothetical protein
VVSSVSRLLAVAARQKAPRPNSRIAGFVSF